MVTDYFFDFSGHFVDVIRDAKNNLAAAAQWDDFFSVGAFNFVHLHFYLIFLVNFYAVAACQSPP